jgi:hypothetical protein
MEKMTNWFKIHVRRVRRKNAGVNGRIVMRRFHSNCECEYVDYSQPVDRVVKC